MNTELVTILLKAGIIKQSEVEKALHYESGSSLIERLLSLGYGSETDVFKIIRNKLKLAVIASESFSNIPKNVIDFIPRDIVEKHHILPFYMDNTTIHIAMFDPTQDPCLNELCFFTSLKVVPYGALASDITKALNKYYGLTLPETFTHRKTPSLREEVTTPDAPLPPLPHSKPVTIPRMQQNTMHNFPPLPDEKITSEAMQTAEVDELKEKLKQMQNSFDRLSKMVAGQSKQDAEIKKVENLKEQIKSIQEEITLSDEILVADVNYEDDVPEFKDISGAFPNQGKQTSHDDIYVNGIEQGMNKDAVLNAVVKEIKKISSRSVILFVRYDDLIPILGIGNGIENNIASLKISLKESSIFKTVYNTKKEFSGPMPADTILDNFVKHFGNHRPQSITLIPSTIDDETFSMIYAEDISVTNELKKITNAMAKAFNRLLNA
ncbi:MAG: hypothetical protein NTY22_04100 [Proteobacteria bacterium]|nr:hypothetical protein [Pseudomonadota bacterium]